VNRGESTRERFVMVDTSAIRAMRCYAFNASEDFEVTLCEKTHNDAARGR